MQSRAEPSSLFRITGSWLWLYLLFFLSLAMFRNKCRLVLSPEIYRFYLFIQNIFHYLIQPTQKSIHKPIVFRARACIYLPNYVLISLPCTNTPKSVILVSLSRPHLRLPLCVYVHNLTYPNLFTTLPKSLLFVTISTYLLYCLLYKSFTWWNDHRQLPRLINFDDSLNNFSLLVSPCINLKHLFIIGLMGFFLC